MRAVFCLIYLFSSMALAQTTGNISSPSNTSSGSFSSDFMAQVRERLKISYFGELSGPNAKRWDDNQSDFEGNRLRDPVNMWHNFNVSTKIYNKTSFVMSPRFYTVFGDRNDLKDNQDQHVVVMDDWQFGLQQQIIKTNSFGWATRLTHRAPFSVDSRNNRIDSQIEWLQVVTWAPISEIFILSQTNLRYYKYEPDAPDERYRMNQLTAFNYILNDRWKIQLFNEFDLQHRSPKDGPKQKDWNYFKKYKNVYATGIGYNFSPNLTLMPFVKALNDQDIRPETIQIGMWAFGRVF